MIVKIHSYSMRDCKWFPRSIVIPPDREQGFRQQAERNHSQTVERLNERGGMSPEEIYFAYYGRRWNSLMTRVDNLDALHLCVELASDRETAA